MSIYATMWTIRFPHNDCGDEDDDFSEVYAQGVLAHIDNVGPDWDFLPPPVKGKGKTMRAVVICGPITGKGTKRNGQEYVKPLMTLTGDEYAAITFRDLLERITDGLSTQICGSCGRPYAMNE